MNLMNIATLPGIQIPRTTANAGEDAAQFDAILYRLMLQNVDLMSGMGGSTKAEHGVFRELITDFLAGETARQQAGYGALMLNMSNTIDGGNT